MTLHHGHRVSLRQGIASFLVAVYATLGVGAPATATALGDELVCEGVHVIPHVQSREMRYRNEADFSLGARVEVFLRNASAQSFAIPAATDIRLRGQTPEELLQSDQWAWHDLPSAWGDPPLQLPAGAMTVWSWNGKREDWGTNTETDLSVSMPGANQPLRLPIRIDEPLVWPSAVTYLGNPAQVQPDSVIFHIVNRTPGALHLDACRLWLPENNADWRVLYPQPWIDVNLERFPANGAIPANDRGGARAITGPLPLTYAALEIRLTDSTGKPVTIWSHQRIKREVFDISGGWVHGGEGLSRQPIESEAFHKTLRRVYVNTAHIMDIPGYTDQTGPDGLYTRYPLKYFGSLLPLEHFDSDTLLPRIHAAESLGEPQYGGGKPVPPQECWKALSIYAPTRLPTSVTHSEERVWRFYAGISDYPHYDAYRVTAPAADSWYKYDRWQGQHIRWGAPLETIGEMSRSLRELNRPRPTAYWSQGPHHDWSGYGGRKRGSPTADELRLQAYHALASRITSLYWFNLSLRSVVSFPDLLEPMTRVGREIRMLEDYYLEGDATSHERVLRDGQPDWDLDVIAGPTGALLFALDSSYTPDPTERVFKFGPPRDCTLRFPLPAYVGAPADLFRVDADGVTQVEHRFEANAVEIHDRISRVAIYVVTSVPGERERLEALRQQLVAGEDSLGFDPGRNADDLAVLREML